MLRLQDVRKTTRRASSGGQRIVYPHFLRDRALAPRIDLAVRYLESMVGRPRSALDQEVMVQLFGDHKIARCIISALASTYRYRTQSFAEVLTSDQVDALNRLDVRVPSELRLWLYRRVNSQLQGFVGGAERPRFMADAAPALGIEVADIDRLATLDASANAILVRTGPVPSADEVIARYNFEIAAAILSSAKLIRLSLHHGPSPVRDVTELCQRAGVRADISGRDVVLQGQQDALSGWARHGARLVRLLSDLLLVGVTPRSGEAIIAAPDGTEWLFRIGADVFEYLGAQTADAVDSYRVGDLLDALRRVESLPADIGVLRRTGNDAGWAFRRARVPLVMAGLVVPSLGVFDRGAQRVVLALAPRSALGEQRLAEVAGRLPLIVIEGHGTDAGTAGAVSSASSLVTWRYDGRSDVARLPALLAQAADAAVRCAEFARMQMVFDDVRRTGVLTERRLAERLGCDEDDVPARMSAPAVAATCDAVGIRYVDGFGLCSRDVIVRAREAATDVARMRADQPVGQAWIVRVLGRRLRDVTGASEGIECLIAYLGAA